MGKKEKEKRDILIVGASEDWVKGHGSTIWLRNHIMQMIIGFALLMILMFIGINMNLEGTIANIYLGSICAVFFVWYVLFFNRYDKAGKRYWNQVKDSEQPIKVQPLPNFRWKFWE